MDPSLQAKIDEMRAITMNRLQALYIEVFGQPTFSTHRDHLVRRIAWKLQASEHGDVSTAARERALQIANEADLQGRPGHPRTRGSLKRSPRKTADHKLLPPGTELSRIYRDRTIVVKVLEKSFEYEGEYYTSLSAVARAVTGTPWNGLVFFGLKKRDAKRTNKRRPRSSSRETGRAA